MVPKCTLAPAEDLELGLELVTFSAIRGTFPLLLSSLSPIFLPSFSCWWSLYGISHRAATRCLGRAVAPFCETQSSVSAELTSLEHRPAEGAGNSRGEPVGSFSAFGGHPGAACDRAPWVSWQEAKLLLLEGRADRAGTSCSAFWMQDEGWELQAGRAGSEDWSQHPNGLVEQ